MNPLLIAINNIIAPSQNPFANPQQTCNKCGNTLPITHYHRRKLRDGEEVRRKTCRSCTLKQRGKPGNRVRPA